MPYRLFVRTLLILTVTFAWNSVFAEFWAPVRQQSYYGVRYVTGGVGFEEQEYLKSKELRSQYTLEVVTASKVGSYISDALVSVTEKSGESLLNVNMDGPLLLAMIPDGSYSVNVTIGSQQQKRDVTIKQGRLQRVVTTWDVVAERLDKPEVSPAEVYPVIPERIDGLEVITIPSVKGEHVPGPGEDVSERQRKLEKARLLREQSLRLEEEALRIEESLR